MMEILEEMLGLMIFEYRILSRRKTVSSRPGFRLGIETDGKAHYSSKQLAGRAV